LQTYKAFPGKLAGRIGTLRNPDPAPGSVFGDRCCMPLMLVVFPVRARVCIKNTKWPCSCCHRNQAFACFSSFGALLFHDEKGSNPAESCDYVCFASLPKQPFAFFILYSAFFLN